MGKTRKPITTRILSAVACAILASSLYAGGIQPAAAAGKLHVYNWGDYINPEVLKLFGKMYDVDVTLDTYGSNQEMLAKIQAGAKGYDIIFPSVWMQDVMMKQGLLAETDINKFPGYKNINPANEVSQEDPHSKYCLPYAWGSVGIVYNKKIVKEPIKGWKDLFELANKKGEKIALLSDPREVLAIGFVMKGYSVNDTNPEHVKEAADYIIDHLKNVAAFTYNSIGRVVSGDLAAAHWYVGANIFVKQHPDTLKYVIPEEGGTKYQEDICVLKSAPNKENAIKFLQFYTDPMVAALNVSQQVNSTANRTAYENHFIPKWILDSSTLNPAPELVEKMQLFHDIGNNVRLYQAQWQRIRAAAAKMK